MLVLSRKSQERIQIGDQITISVLAVKGNVVRIGIEAPTNIHIVRGELPPLDKTPNLADATPMITAASAPQPNSSPKQSADSPIVPVVGTPTQSTRKTAIRLPALQSRIHRRMDALKSERFRDPSSPVAQECTVHCCRVTTS